MIMRSTSLAERSSARTAIHKQTLPECAWRRAQGSRSERLRDQSSSSASHRGRRPEGSPCRLDSKLDFPRPYGEGSPAATRLASSRWRLDGRTFKRREVGEIPLPSGVHDRRVQHPLAVLEKRAFRRFLRILLKIIRNLRKSQRSGRGEGMTAGCQLAKAAHPLMGRCLRREVCPDRGTLGNGP